MLRKKELADIAAREAEMEKRFAMLDMKTAVIGQMKEQEHLRQQARKEYEKERNQVDRIINKMIEEDHEMMRITKMKQEQSKQDMILSVNEKKALVKRQRELEQYEEELVRRYQGQQAARGEELANIKAAAEAQRDAIFKKLAAEEAARRAEFEYVENMRNELNVQEQEERARENERKEMEKRLRQKQELQNAKEYQMKLKAERQEEERRMENEFKIKMAEKFAEDERLEQMNAQKRRMRELEHKREIERLWQEKLSVYRAQREQEWEERRYQEEQEALQRQVIEQEKNRLLQEHASILGQFNPKAASQYGH